MRAGTKDGGSLGWPRCVGKEIQQASEAEGTVGLGMTKSKEGVKGVTVGKTVQPLANLDPYPPGLPLAPQHLTPERDVPGARDRVESPARKRHSTHTTPPAPGRGSMNFEPRPVLGGLHDACRLAA